MGVRLEWWGNDFMGDPDKFFGFINKFDDQTFRLLKDKFSFK